MIFISINSGKRFEQNWKSSIEELDNVWIYRLKDNAASFGDSKKTRFASHNMCDFIMLHDDTRTFYCLELKSTQETRIPLSMIRENQIKELTEAGKHNIVAGFVVNYRNENNDTFFIEICDFNRMISEINKKSFNIKDLKKYNAIPIESECKKVNYKYNIKNFINETHL